jgi:YVTN family beta-propeller protein
MRILRLSFSALLLLCTVTAFAADSGTLLVLNKSDDTVSLLDVASKKSVATIPTGAGPHEVAVSPDGRMAVVCNYGSQAAPGNSLTVIDVPGRKVLRTIDLQEFRRPHGAAWLRGNEVAITTEGSKDLHIVDVASGKVTATIKTDQNGSHMVALAPKRDRAFVANIGSGTVSAIDLKQKRLIANIPSGEGTEGIDVSPDQREVWATNRGANTLSVIDVASLKVVATLESKSFPIRAKFTADGNHVLVSNAQSGDVAVFDARTRKEVRRIAMQSVGSSQAPVPVGILVMRGLSRAYVANTNADMISVIDLQTWRIVDRLIAGKEPDGLGYSQLVP